MPTPVLKHIIAFSGGLSSFEVARLCVETFGKDTVECVFTDTLTEDEDLYRFIEDSLLWLGCQYTRLCYGKNIWEIFLEKRFHGNSRIDTCSKYLKREMFRKYLQTFDPTETVLYYGIQIHEKHRFEAIQERWKPFQVEAPLIAIETSKEQILHTLGQLGIEPPRLYDMGFEHNNCGGFCVKTGQRQMAHLLKVLPTRYRWHEEQQEKLFKEIGQYGFIKRTSQGITEYLSLKEFRELLESGGIPQLYSDGACACFT